MDEKNRKLLSVILIAAVSIIAVTVIIVYLAFSMNRGTRTSSSSSVSDPASSQTELSKEESSKAELSGEESSKAELSKEESSKAELSGEESSKAELSEEESSKAELSGEESSKAESSGEESSSEQPSKSYKEVIINGETYYQVVSADLWQGEYHQDTFDMYNSNYTMEFKVGSYSDYLKAIEDVNASLDDKKLTAAYSDEASNYIIMTNSDNHSWCRFALLDVIEEDKKIIIYGSEYINGFMASGSGYFIAVPTKMPVGTELDFRQCNSESVIENIRNYGTTYDPNNLTVDKPVIYLYPTEKTKVSVKLLKDNNITCSYPKYQDGWEVIADTDGTLTDTKTGRELYSLYYEAKDSVDFTDIKEGFIVKGEEAASFLEEKLAVLGLNEKEAEEFIIYWLPRLEANRYNLIRFAAEEEINENMTIEVSPAPDSVIRIIMIFKGLDGPVDIPEQSLSSPERNGFTLIEWGGEEIKNKEYEGGGQQAV